ARPAETPEGTEIVDLQDASIAEHFQPLLRERPAAIGEIMHRADGAVGESEVEAGRVGVRGPRPAGDERMAGEKAQQVDEVAGLAENAPAAGLRVLRPVTGGNGSGID